MNIFASYAGNKACASVLDDKRVTSQTKESAQMLATAIHTSIFITPEYNEISDLLPKPAFMDHPCTIWTGQSQQNYVWLLKHFEYLLNEFFKRRKKYHAYEKLLVPLEKGLKWIPKGPRTPFVNCTVFKGIQDTHLAYRMYLTMKWDNDILTPKWYGDPERRPW